MWCFLLYLVSAIAALYAYFQYKYTFWKRMGVPNPKPKFPFGNRTVTSGRQSTFAIQAFYNQFKDAGSPLFGLYFLQQPVAIASSLEMVKNVLIKDFASFTDRGIYYNEKEDPISAHLFAVDGEKWHKLRHKLSPTFTSGKMKFMYPTMIDVAQRFNECAARTVVVNGNQQVEMKELLARFTTDVIGTCAFGIECNSLEDPNAIFRTMGRKAFSEPRHKGFAVSLIRAFPSIARRLGVKAFPDDVASFFMKVVRDTVEYREANNIERNDFMDLLIKMKNDDKDPLSIEEIAPQAFIFFLAGFETSSTTMVFALYELALCQDVQRKAREEITRVLRKHGGQFTYEAMMEMHYVEHVINETLRKYPPVPMLVREAIRDYPVPNTAGAVLPRGTTILIPSYAFQHDPNIYPNPDAFQPERFEAAARAERENVAFLPFGDGPRNCIGARFGMMQSRIGIVTLLLNYEISPSSLTPVPMVYDMSNFVLSPLGGMWLNMKKINS